MTTKEFQYVITINQKAVVECGLNVDIVDMAVFDFMMSYSASPKCTKVFFENKFYFHLSSSVILERMPMLGISTKRGVCKRIDNLINAGLIERHPNNQEIGKTMYTFGSTYDQYIFCTTKEQKFQGGTNKSSKGVRTDVPTPMNESSDNNNTSYNNTSYNNNSSNSLIINNNPIPTTPYIPQGGLESELSRSELIFEEFRKFYKGTKRGLKTEFENFKKKNKDWKEVLPTLLEKYKAQKEAKEKIRLNGGFVPQEKNLQTYLNQRCWEEEINTTNLERYGTISTQQTDTAEKPHERVLREMLEFTRNNVPELC